MSIKNNSVAAQEDALDVNAMNADENLKVQAIPADFIELVQNQFETVKTDIKQRVDSVVEQFPVKKDHIASLKDTLKAEVIHLYDDLAHTAQTFKTEFAALSQKYKSHLVEELLKSKENALGALNRINSSKMDKQ